MMPDQNAAGNLGLFRIIFSFFYIWHLSTQFFENLSGLPSIHWSHNLYLLRYFFKDLGEPLPIAFFNILESCLIVALVLLLFGYKTRIATFLVLVLGGLVEALHTATDIQRATVILTFYIPLFMLITNRWGDTYSADSFLEYCKSGTYISPSESYWIYSLPARSVLIVLSVLFFSSAVFKISLGGQWLVYPELISNLVLHRTIKSAVLGLPLNPLAPFISQTPVLHHSLRITTLLFEGFFFLSLFSRTLRDFFVSLALIFHSFNAIWLAVTFTSVLIGYGLFIDWEALKENIWPQQKHYWQNNIDPNILIFGILFLSILIGILWSQDIIIQRLFNLDGLINVSTIWYPVFPFSLCWFAVNVIKMFKKEWN
ncbi:MAG: hypothetical protein QNJ18_05155 [Xenococcaceae cyanobacterium MO_167.B52]|nr:hypothetical protein [Xenococcaceae cyanobacterium MO_167.B52]